MADEGQQKRWTEDDMRELRAWKFPFIPMNFHAEIEHGFRLCMDGIEHGVLIGPRGVGKTESVKRIKEQLAAEEYERCASDPAYTPRQIVSYTASKATGMKTALIDLFDQVCGHVSPAARRFLTPKAMIDLIADELMLQQVALICVDEAQFINPENLDLLRQVPDRVAECNNNVGLLLIGSEELHSSLAQIRQIGQRFAAEIVIPPLTLVQMHEHINQLHPHIPRMRASMTKTEWRVTVDKLHRATGGKFRRLRNVIENANALAIEVRQSVDVELLQLAIAKLAAEN